VHSGEGGNFDSNNASTTESYEIMFAALDYAKKSGLIAASASWQVSSGGIAIHPYKDRILSLVAMTMIFQSPR
jgi:predicted phosphatase